MLSLSPFSPHWERWHRTLYSVKTVHSLSSCRRSPTPDAKEGKTLLGARTTFRLSPFPSIKCVCLDHGRRLENRREFSILEEIFWQREIFFTFFSLTVQALFSRLHLSDPT